MDTQPRSTTAKQGLPPGGKRRTRRRVTTLLAVASAVMLLAGAAFAAVGAGSPSGITGPLPGLNAQRADKAAKNSFKKDKKDPGRIAWVTKYGQDRSTMPVQPDVSAATPEQKAAALDLLQRTRAATAAYSDPQKAAAAGYDIQAALQKIKGKKPAKFQRLTSQMPSMPTMPSGKGRMPMIHVGNTSFKTDGAVLDPAKPETLMFTPDGSGGFKLVGVMFSAVQSFPNAPPDPGGPITRWHYHSGNGGAKGGLMMHIFFGFGDDLARAYATTMS